LSPILPSTFVGCDEPRNDEAVVSSEASHDADSETDDSAVLVAAPTKDSDNNLAEKHAADVLTGKFLASLTAKRYATTAIICLLIR
jgi:hypothetical protein